ncbi:MAG TPA: TIGR03435 family protein [Bryobacteraceae bacterium]
MRKDLPALGAFGPTSRLFGRIEALVDRGRVFSSNVSLTRIAVSAAVLLALAAGASLAPRWLAFAQMPEFEVASIRPYADGERNSPLFTADGIAFHGVALTAVIGEAYNFPYGRIAGPNSRTPESLWGLLSSGYDIVAKAGRPASKEQLRLMLQALLKDRFKLSLHLETKTAPLYKLVAAKNGPKLDESEIPGVFTMSFAEDSYVFRNTEMMRFIGFLAGHLDRPVVDQTGLAGRYNFKLKAPRLLSATEPEDVPPKSEVRGDWVSSSLFADLKQIGLELAGGGGSVDYLVVDHVEKPSEN